MNLKKRTDSGVSDFTEIVDQADSICRSITMVEVLQSFAGKVWAFKTKLDFPFGDEPAMSLQVRTVLVPGSAAGAMRDFASFRRDVVRERKIGAARAAVYSTRSNLFGCKHEIYLSKAFAHKVDVSPETSMVEIFSIIAWLVVLGPFCQSSLP